jgi:hypothetical protein
MLYQLLNEGRFPFSPMASQMPKAEDGEKALEERMQGKKLPAPSVLAVFEKTDMDLRGTDKSSLTELVDIILKACSYQTEDRYQNASEMAEELKKWVIKNEYERGTPVRKQEEPFESLGSTSIKTGNNKQPPNDAGNSVGGEGAEVSKQDEGTIGYIDIPRDKSNREMVKIENGEPEQPEKSEPITVQKGKKEPEKEKKEEKKDKKWFINFFLFFGVYFLIYIVCMGCELSYLGSIMTGDIIPFIQWPFLFLCTNILPTIYFVGLLVLQKGVMDKWLWCVTIAIAEICGTVVFIAFYRIGTNLMPANGENIELWLLIVQNLLIIGTFISTLTKKMKIIHSGH